MESIIHLELGKKYLKELKRNWVKNSYLAEQHLLEATKDQALADEAFYFLISLALKIGDYKKSRNYIQKYQETFQKEANNPFFYYIYSKLELEEYNFNQALAYRYQYFEASERKTLMLLNLVYYHLQLGQNDIAKEICKCVLKDYHARAKALLMLSNIALLEKNLEEAKNLLSKINTDKLNEQDFYTYKECLKQVKLLDMDNNYKDQLRLLNEKEQKQEFLRHIEKHKNKDLYGNSVFDEEINLEELYQQLVKKKQTTNGIYYPHNVNFKLFFDHEIGTRNNERTNAVELITINEKSLITAYPIIVSPFFNRENLANDPILMKRRLQQKRR